MSKIDLNYSPEIFRKDQPMVIATNRGSAILLPVRLAYDSDGYVAGQVLGRNTSTSRFEKYDSGGSNDLDIAACVLFHSVAAQDFDSTAATGSTTAVGIFGGCTLFEDKLIDLDADAKTDLGARTIIDASGVELLKF